MNLNTVKMEVTAIPENISVLRLTASGMASKAGLDIEEIEDIKVCISEACTNAIRYSEKPVFYVEISIQNKSFNIKVSDKGRGMDIGDIPNPNPMDPKEGGLGIFIIKSLMDEVEISTNDQGTTIDMKKYLGEVK